MAQTFKLRLGDGTELVVDHDGLRTWSVDEKAAVKTKSGWRGLREVLAVLDRPPKPDDGMAVIGLKRLDDAPRVTHRPPPSTGELKTLSFAATGDDEPVEEDVYDGPTAIGTAWMWMKRAMLLAGIGVGGYFAATTWQIWLPKAGELGVAILGQIDKTKGSASVAAPENTAAEAAEGRRVIDESAAQLPHLSPQAIERVMSSSLAGTLEPPEVFRRALEATDRGAAALTAEEAQELKSLRASLMATLTPVERERMREYDQARGFRATLAFEDKAALGSYAHAARLLAAPRRERLRKLHDKAIAAALAAPADASRAVAAR